MMVLDYPYNGFSKLSIAYNNLEQIVIVIIFIIDTKNSYF